MPRRGCLGTTEAENYRNNLISMVVDLWAQTQSHTIAYESVMSRSKTSDHPSEDVDQRRELSSE